MFLNEPNSFFLIHCLNIYNKIARISKYMFLSGFLKWSIGLYIPVVGRWGLDSLLKTSGMSEYFERELKYKCVVMDEHGAPVHPDTRKRTVRICSRYNKISIVIIVQ